MIRVATIPWKRRRRARTMNAGHQSSTRASTTSRQESASLARACHCQGAYAYDENPPRPHRPCRLDLHKHSMLPSSQVWTPSRFNSPTRGLHHLQLVCSAIRFTIDTAAFIGFRNVMTIADLTIASNLSATVIIVIASNSGILVQEQ